MQDTFLVPTPGTLVTCELAIKRSRFITYLTRVDDEAAAREFIAEIKHTYPDARHHCSAFIYAVDDANPVERSSDDGEPSGTAGMPMLDTLRGSGLSNIAAVVVRYFGGIKLGTGGLVRAYSDAVAAGLPQVVPVRRSRQDIFTLELPHTDAGRIEADLRGRGYAIVDTVYGAGVELHIACNPGEGEALAGIVAGLTSGAAAPKEAGTRWVEYPV
ncbi:YigZ family protein [Corynebacterium sp. 13CS0277]|uniref:YigZ family protein n=1 Tax=Corynebacterium sp. 13CS0277 TaxID=2071994 RepID=UPI000D031E25|nr:YigZ family protein [Corynebacterium sp. 13CS0277]PRQ12492.1 YigZ family protein [Corynebacterium sp. 13CS0277]